MRRPGAFTSEDYLKIAVILAIVAADAAWIELAGFGFAFPSVIRVLAAVGVLLLVAELYRRWRPNPSFVVMVRETAWLLAFSAAAAVFSNLVVTLNLPAIDPLLAAWDRALHFDWQAYYAWVVGQPVLGLAYALLYFAALPFIAFGVIALAVMDRTARASELVLAAMVGALIAIAISGLFPSSGALAYFRPDETLALHHPIVDLDYKQAYFDLRSGTWTSFTLDDIRGLIAFPSYHAVLNTIIVLAFRGIRRFFWPLLILNLGMLATAPVEGGHHLVDVIGGVVVAIVATCIASRLQRWLTARARRARATATPPLEARLT
jgi:membrane-associated phospholipid phosphatase